MTWPASDSPSGAAPIQRRTPAPSEIHAVIQRDDGLVFQGGQQWVVEGLHKQMLDQFSHGLAAAAMG